MQRRCYWKLIGNKSIVLMHYQSSSKLKTTVLRHLDSSKPAAAEERSIPTDLNANAGNATSESSLLGAVHDIFPRSQAGAQSPEAAVRTDKRSDNEHDTGDDQRVSATNLQLSVAGMEHLSTPSCLPVRVPSMMIPQSKVCLSYALTHSSHS